MIKKNPTKSQVGIRDTNGPILSKLPTQQGGEEGHQEGLAGHGDTGVCNKGSSGSPANAGLCK